MRIDCIIGPSLAVSALLFGLIVELNWDYHAAVKPRVETKPATHSGHNEATTAKWI